MIHHVQLAAPPGSEQVARAFWVDALGFQEIEKPSAVFSRGGCWFRGHGIEIHLGVEVDFRPARKAHPGMLVTEIDAWADRLAAAGYDVTWDDGSPGVRRFYTEDPFRNRLEFLESRGSEMAATDPR